MRRIKHFRNFRPEWISISVNSCDAKILASSDTVGLVNIYKCNRYAFSLSIIIVVPSNGYVYLNKTWDSIPKEWSLRGRSIEFRLNSVLTDRMRIRYELYLSCRSKRDYSGRDAISFEPRIFNDRNCLVLKRWLCLWSPVNIFVCFISIYCQS